MVPADAVVDPFVDVDAELGLAELDDEIDETLLGEPDIVEEQAVMVSASAKSAATSLRSDRRGMRGRLHAGPVNRTRVRTTGGSRPNRAR